MCSVTCAQGYKPVPGSVGRTGSYACVVHQGLRGPRPALKCMGMLVASNHTYLHALFSIQPEPPHTHAPMHFRAKHKIHSIRSCGVPCQCAAREHCCRSHVSVHVWVYREHHMGCKRLEWLVCAYCRDLYEQRRHRVSSGYVATMYIAISACIIMCVCAICSECHVCVHVRKYHVVV
jgi:hypothetical protein